MRETAVLQHEAIAGCCAGVVGTVFGYPFDVIKTRMQTSHLSIPNTIQIIYKESGINGFYRGIGSPLLALTILNTMNFSLYNHFCRILRVRSIDNQSFFSGNYAIAAACVGPFASMISTPFELVKTQVQLQKKSITTISSKPMNTVSMIRHILNQYGPSYLYKGHAVNTTREIVFLSTYFMTYENLKHGIISTFSSFSSFWSTNVAIPLAGGISGACGWFVSFPLDSIKSSIQGANFQTLKETNISKSSAFDIAKKIMREKGFRGLYSGVIPSITRSFIVSATRFSVYEFCLYFLEGTSNL
jgi:solute carrier family 25 (mitochondrial carnitine/acylcarnitine transporter), member 20/29